jgi:hypothetical protein
MQILAKHRLLKRAECQEDIGIGQSVILLVF